MRSGLRRLTVVPTTTTATTPLHVSSGGLFASTSALLSPKKSTTKAESEKAKKKRKGKGGGNVGVSGKKKQNTSSSSLPSSSVAASPSSNLLTSNKNAYANRFYIDSYRAILKELQRADVLHLGNVDHVVRGIFGALMDVDTLVESGLYRPSSLVAPLPSASTKKSSGRGSSAAAINNGKGTTSPAAAMQFNGPAASHHYIRFVDQLRQYQESFATSSSSSSSKHVLFSNEHIAALAPTIRFFFENPSLALEVSGFGDVPFVGSSVPADHIGGGEKSVGGWLRDDDASGSKASTVMIADKVELFQSARFRLCLDFIRAIKASTVGLPVNGVYQTRLLLGGFPLGPNYFPPPAIVSSLSTSLLTKVEEKKKRNKGGSSTTANNNSGSDVPSLSTYTFPIIRSQHPTNPDLMLEAMPTCPPGTLKVNFESALSVVEDAIPHLKGRAAASQQRIPREEGIAYPRGVVTPGSLTRIAVPRSPSSPLGATEIAPSSPSSSASSYYSPPSGSVANPAMAPEPFAPPTVPDRFRLGTGLVNLCIPIDPFHAQNLIETRPCTLVPITLLIESLAYAARSNGTPMSTPSFFPAARNSEAVRYLSIPEAQFLPHTAMDAADSPQSGAASKARGLFGLSGVGCDTTTSSKKKCSKAKNNKNNAASTDNASLQELLPDIAFNRVRGFVTVANLPSVYESMMATLKTSAAHPQQQQPPSTHGSNNKKTNNKSQQQQPDEESMMAVIAGHVATVFTHPTLLKAFYPFYAYMSGGIASFVVEGANTSSMVDKRGESSASTTSSSSVHMASTLPRVVDRDTGASIASLRDATLAGISQSGVWYIPTLLIGSRAPSRFGGGGGIAAHLKLLRSKSSAGWMRDSYVAFAASSSPPAASKTAGSRNKSSDVLEEGSPASLLQVEAEGWLKTIAVLSGTSSDVTAMEKAIALPTTTREYLLKSANEELNKLEAKGWKRTELVAGGGEEASNAAVGSSTSSSVNRMLPTGGLHPSSAVSPANTSASDLVNLRPHAAKFYERNYSPITNPAAFFSRLSSLNLANSLPTTTITETNGIVRVVVTTRYMGARDPAEEEAAAAGGSMTPAAAAAAGHSSSPVHELVSKHRTETGTHASSSGKRITSDALGLQEGYLHYYQYSVTIQNISSKTQEADAPHTQSILTGRKPSTIALLSRHWVFCDALGFEDRETAIPSSSSFAAGDLVPGVVREVVGPGVVGNNPILAPGESFSYDSGVCCKRSDGVYMRGKLQFVMLDNMVEYEDNEQANIAAAVTTSPAPDMKENGVILSTLIRQLPDAVVSAAVHLYRMSKDALPTITVQKYDGNTGDKKKGQKKGSGASFALRVDMPASWMRNKPVPEHHFDAHVAATALRADRF